jgi:sulfopyruvate decarboxylase subunit beta
MGTLATLGAVAPGNLTVLLIQNGVHAASGGQPLTNPTLDLAQLARSAGVGHATKVETAQSFANALSSAFAAGVLQVIVLATEPDPNVVQSPVTLDPVLTKHRFMAAIDAPRYIPTIFGGGRFQ